MKNILAGCLVMLASLSSVNAEVFRFQLFERDIRDDGLRDFFTDYKYTTQCFVEIDDAAIGPNVFVDIASPEFKKFSCDVTGTYDTYSFDAGSDVIPADYVRGSDPALPPSQRYRFGLLFDSDAKPLRFDSPEFSFSNLIGIFDGPEIRPAFNSDSSFLEILDDNDFDTPIAVLLEPALIGAIERPVGYTIPADRVPPGTQIALLNGNFGFFEQPFAERDADGKFGPRRPDALVLRSGLYTFDEQLVTPQMRITQGALVNGQTISLIHQRATAIILDRGPLFSDRNVEFVIVDASDPFNKRVVFRTNEISFDDAGIVGQKIFICNQVTNFCNLKKDTIYEFEITLDSGEIFEQVQMVKVVELVPFAISFFFATPEMFCSTEYCSRSPETIEQIVNESEANFLLKYPVSPKTFEVLNKPPKTFPASTNADAQTATVDDINTAFLFAKKTPVSRATLLVSSEYDKLRGETPPASFTGPGFLYTDYPNTGVVNLDAAGLASVQGVLHEIGHSFGLFVDGDEGAVEDYDLFPPDGAPASWFDFSRLEIVNSPRTFMGRGNPANLSEAQNFGVSQEQWEIILASLINNNPDPEILVIAGILDKFNNIVDLKVDEQVGFPSTENRGDGRFILRTDNGEIVSEHSIVVSPGAFLFEGSGRRPASSRPFQIVIEYPMNGTTIELFDGNNQLLLREDAVIQTLKTLVRNVGKACRNSAPVTGSFLNSIDRLDQEIKNNHDLKKSDIETIRAISNQIFPSSCNLTNSAFGTKGALEDKFELAIGRFAERFGIDIDTPEIVPGDLDQDGDVDRNDLNILLASRNQPAAGPDDPKDLDEDGTITGLDGRKLTQLCTRPRCAVE